MERRDKFWYVVFLLIYWSDWFVVGVFVTFILMIWYYTGVFQYSTFAGVGDFNKWTWGTLVFFALIPHFIIYLSYFPRSFRIKRKMIYFSDFNNPVYIFFALYFILAYFIIATYGFGAVLPSFVDTPGGIAHDILGILFLGIGATFLFAFYLLGPFVAYHLIIDKHWYRKFGIEPMTWEEAMQLYGS